MNAVVQELPQAIAPPCDQCHAESRRATCLNQYGRTLEDGTVGTAHWYACDEHVTAMRGYSHSYDFDLYLPILLATVGDELWISLECWTRQLGEQVRIMAEAVRS